MLGTGMPTLAPILEVAGREGPPVVSCMLCLAWRAIEAVKGAKPSHDTLQRWIAGEGWGSRLAERRAGPP